MLPIERHINQSFDSRVFEHFFLSGFGFEDNIECKGSVESWYGIAYLFIKLETHEIRINATILESIHKSSSLEVSLLSTKHYWLYFYSKPIISLNSGPTHTQPIHRIAVLTNSCFKAIIIFLSITAFIALVMVSVGPLKTNTTGLDKSI